MSTIDDVQYTKRTLRTLKIEDSLKQALAPTSREGAGRSQIDTTTNQPNQTKTATVAAVFISTTSQSAVEQLCDLKRDQQTATDCPTAVPPPINITMPCPTNSSHKLLPKIFCEECGGRIDTKKFCKGCGKDLQQKYKSKERSCGCQVANLQEIVEDLVRVVRQMETAGVKSSDQGLRDMLQQSLRGHPLFAAGKRRGNASGGRGSAAAAGRDHRPNLTTLFESEEARPPPPSPKSSSSSVTVTTTTTGATPPAYRR
eukprot:m.13187 g.13187  ORF g.13187 m.13187 type:complete len:257 (-) comp4485_c0_seq1:300-1070(-)